MVRSAVDRSNLFVTYHFLCGAGYGVLPVLNYSLYRLFFAFDQVYGIITRTGFYLMGIFFAASGGKWNLDLGRARSGSGGLDIFFSLMY